MSMSGSPVAAEFPTLDLEELEDAPLRPAVHVDAVERCELPGILAACLPGVVCARHTGGHGGAVYEFVDATSGAAVRYVLKWSEREYVEAMVAESGHPGSFDRLVAACAAWERAGRPDPARWAGAVEA